MFPFDLKLCRFTGARVTGARYPKFSYESRRTLYKRVTDTVQKPLYSWQQASQGFDFNESTHTHALTKPLGSDPCNMHREFNAGVSVSKTKKNEILK